MKKLTNIKDLALNIGACDKISKVSDYKSLVDLFFSPQGREFCQNNNYPTLGMFRTIKEDVKPYRVFVDTGSIETYNEPNIALVGNTHGKIKIRGVDSLYHVILMHGATAEIDISHYAVAQIINISGGYVAIHNDKTTKVHYEPKPNSSH